MISVLHLKENARLRYGRRIWKERKKFVESTQKKNMQKRQKNKHFRRLDKKRICKKELKILGKNVDIFAHDSNSGCEVALDSCPREMQNPRKMFKMEDYSTYTLF